ncbi:MAG: hypothetical protein IKR25_03850 [Muribaculaceae bacterium]|nr:hypothetical protein [Muribaculaceae bacterium]
MIDLTQHSRRTRWAAALLVAMLLPATAAGDNVSLQVDNDYDAGDVRHNYVNLTHSGRNTLILDGTVTSFKVYDDGGGKVGGFYSHNCNSWLEIQAPSGYVLRINGSMTATQYDRFSLYDGSSDTDYALVDEMEVYDNVPTNIGHHMSSGRNLLLHFWVDGTHHYDGLNLTVDLVPATTSHQIQIIGTEGGTVTANKTSAKAGELITLTIEEELGYTLAGVRVHSEPRNLLETVCFRSESTWYYPGDYTVTFSMPNTDATVIPVMVAWSGMSAENGLYIDMPTHGTKSVYLRANVQSVSIYDDGGGGVGFNGLGNSLGYSHNYSRCCDSYLKLEAPEGHVIKLTGTMDTQYGDYLTVYDGLSQWNSVKLADKLGFESGEANVGTIVSSSNEMMLYFSSEDSPTHIGLDLKVEAMLPIRFEGEGTAEVPYLIQNSDDWTRFCNALQENDTWDHFDGKHLKLCDNIYIDAMAGSYGHEFKGSFDGGGHTINFTHYSISDTIAAPFRYVAGTATIKNVKVAGTLNTTADYAAGLVGSQEGNTRIDSCEVNMSFDGQKYLAQFVARASGTTTITASIAKGYIYARGKYAAGFVARANGTVNITNCLSSTFLFSWVDGDGTHGGFVGENQNSSTVNIEGCLFNGYFITDYTNKCAGFVGWRKNVVNISNSLFMPKTNGFKSDGSATFCRNTPTSITNCYYNETLGEAQGKMMRAIIAGDNVTLANAGTAIEYGVSGITSYGTGILYGDILYAGLDDEVQLDLFFTGTEEIDGFTTSAGQLTGTENPYTLTMPDQDVTVSATIKPAVVLGDLNGDATVDVGDVNILINLVLEINNDPIARALADINGDSTIDISDVNALINIILNN